MASMYRKTSSFPNVVLQTTVVRSGRKNLSEYFTTDFETFTCIDFNVIPNNDRRFMHYLLRQQGLFVEEGRGILIVEAKVVLVGGDKKCPEDEIENHARLVTAVFIKPPSPPNTFHCQDDAPKTSCDNNRTREDFPLMDRVRTVLVVDMGRARSKRF